MLRHLTQKPTVLITFQVIFVQALTILLFAIQAPLLGPRAFGLIAIVMIVVGFCETVITAVATDTLISVAVIEDLHFATATFVTAAAALLLGAIMFASAGAIAALVGDAELAPVLKAMAVLPVISAFWVAPNAATKREMQFKVTVTRSIVSLGISGIVGVVLAFLGAGVWALVWQALTHRLTGAIALWLAVPLRFRPRFSRRHFRELRRIAAPLLAGRCMSWASGQIPRSIIGVYLGTVNLGFYSLGSRFTDILIRLTIEPDTTVARIGFRGLAAEPHGLEQRVRRLFMRTSALCFPLCIGAAAIVPTLFHAWLDARWLGGIVCAQLLLLSCIPYVTYYCTSAILLALNRRGAEAAISTAQALVTGGAVLLAVRSGIDVAAGAVSGGLLALLPLPLMLLKRRCGISIRAVLGAQTPALVAAVLMGAGVWLIGRKLEASFSSPALLVILVVSGAIIYGAAIAALAPRLVREQLHRLFALAGGAAGEARTTQ